MAAHVLLKVTESKLDETIAFYKCIGFRQANFDVSYNNNSNSKAKGDTLPGFTKDSTNNKLHHLYFNKMELVIEECQENEKEEGPCLNSNSVVQLSLEVPEEDFKLYLKKILNISQSSDNNTNDSVINLIDPNGVPVTMIKQSSGKGSKANQSNQKRIAFLTSGGDSQGMNAAIRAIVRMSIYKNCIPYAIHEGYQGLVDGGSKIMRMDWNDVAQILSEGGTIIKTARCKEFRTRDGRLKAARNLLINRIDCLILIGGDGTLTGADLFRQEWKGLLEELVAKKEISAEVAQAHMVLNIAGMVGSIDNDMIGTEVTIGCNSALTRIVNAIDCISCTASSHSRAFIIEVMGRNCGWLALMAAIATGADGLFIPEVPPSKSWKEDLCQSLKRNKDLGKKTSIVVVSEGAVDENNERISCEMIKEALDKTLGMETRITILGHVQRGGVPTVFDRFLATVQGIKAVEAVLAATPDSPSPMISMNENNISTSPLVELVQKTRAVGEAMRQKDFKKAFSMRDSDFKDGLELYNELARASFLVPVGELSPATAKAKIAVIHCGAPACGINAATKAIVQSCLAKGYSVLGVQNGFDGLLRGQVKELSWLGVDGWESKGGSELGMNRSLPSHNIGGIAHSVAMLGISAMIIIGGFEGIIACNELNLHQKEYPALRIPIILIPATISNNVPGTDYSIGCDTALNSIVTACDTIRISASSSRKRVFIIEVHGGSCGFLATFAGIAAGATYSYTAEEGISLADIQRDVNHLKARFNDDKKQGRLLIKNEGASKTYTCDLLSKVFEEEGGRSFDSRSCVLGHTQQGGIPSPLDRIRAVRMAVLSVDHIEKCLARRQQQQQTLQCSSSCSSLDNVELLNDEVAYLNSKCEAVVIGIRGPNIQFSSVTKLIKEDSDLHLRRPRNQWWIGIRPYAKILAKYDVKEQPQ